MRIDQFVPSFVKADAISNHVVQACHALRAAGFESDIWYEAADPRVAREGRQFRECPSGADDGRVILYHASTHSAMVPWLEKAAAGGQRFALDYHNITPPKYFARWEPAAAASMRVAREELARLVPLAGLAVADSGYNRDELVELGHTNTAVCPLLLDLGDYHQAPDAKLLARLRSGAGSRWLFVGRIAPNKCQHDVIASFAVYRKLFDPDARLTLVGGATALRYLRDLKVMAADLGVADAVEIPESAPFRELLAYFGAADVFVCLSEHEGFCVPVIEAMELGVPVVAFNSSAVGDTVSDGGVLIDGKDPLGVAAAVDAVLSDPGQIESLKQAGQARAAEFSLEVTSEVLVSTLRDWLGLRA